MLFPEFFLSLLYLFRIPLSKYSKAIVNCTTLNSIHKFMISQDFHLIL